MRIALSKKQCNRRRYDHDGRVASSLFRCTYGARGYRGEDEPELPQVVIVGEEGREVLAHRRTLVSERSARRE